MIIKGERIIMDKRKIVKCGVYAVIVLSLFLFITKSCNLYNSYSVLKGQYELLQAENNSLIEISQKEISKYQNKIAERDRKIEEITETVAIKTKKIQELSEISTNLEQEIAGLNNKDIIINKLKENITIWKQKFTIAESIIADKDKIIFNLQEKYEAQLKISLNYKEMYEKSHQLLLLSNKQLKLADRKIRSARLFSSVKTIAIGAIAGYIIYDKVVK